MPKNIGLEITRYGTPPLAFMKKVQTLRLTAEQTNIAIGEKAKDYMRKVISDNTKRPGSNKTLHNAIEKHVENGGKTVGVGKVSQLPVYWAVQNNGSSHLVGKRVWGHFSPGNPVPSTSSFRDGRMVHHSTGTEPFYPINITKPIPPMNYVEKTVNWTALIYRADMNKALNKVAIKTFSFSTGGLG